MWNLHTHNVAIYTQWVTGQDGSYRFPLNTGGHWFPLKPTTLVEMSDPSFPRSQSHDRSQDKVGATLPHSRLARNLERQPYFTGLTLLSKESQTSPNLFIAPLLPPFPSPPTVLLGTILGFQAEGFPSSTSRVGSPTPTQAWVGRTWCPTFGAPPASTVPSPAGWGTFNPLVMWFFWF